jgi:hypothetical protein
MLKLTLGYSWSVAVTFSLVASFHHFVKNIFSKKILSQTLFYKKITKEKL